MADVERFAIPQALLERIAASGSDASDPVAAELLAEKRRADARVLGPVITPSHSEVRRALAVNERAYLDALRRRAEPDAASVAAGRAAFDARADLTRWVLGGLGGVHIGPSSVVTLSEPIAILESPKNFGTLVGTSVAAYTSRAKVDIGTNTAFRNEPQNVDFWYFWQNPNPYGAFIDIFAPVVFNGTFSALCGAGALSGSNRVAVGISIVGYAYNQGGVDEQLIASRPLVVGSIVLEGGLFSSDSATYRFDHEEHDFGGRAFVKPGGVLIRISVQFTFSFTVGEYTNDNDPADEIWCDFATDRWDYFIQNSGVRLNVTQYDPFGAES